MLRKIANLTSYLTHPLWLPTLSAVFILFFLPLADIPKPLHLSGTMFSDVVILVYVIISTAIMPLFVFYYMQKKSKIDSIRMHTAKERILPSIVLIGIHLVNMVLFLSVLHAPLLFFVSLVAAFVIAVSYVSVSWFDFKISLHTSSIAAFAVATLVLYFMHITTWALVLAMFGLCILVGVARWVLKAHSLSQVLSGYALGVATVLLYFVLELF